MATLPNYKLIKIIGAGSFGYVFEAFDVNNNRKVALKRIEKVGDQLSREYEILFEIKDCKNIIKILDFFYSRTEDKKLIQNIVFEYMEDNLENLIGKYTKIGRKFTGNQVKNYIHQTLKGLEYIHSKNIAHRDLKPENILINTSDDVIKICDFGSSKFLDPNGKNTPYIVSRYYRAPELFLCTTKYTTSIDIWATGCILAELIIREPIFQGKTEGEQLFAIFKVLGSPSSEVFKEFSERVPFDPSIFSKFPFYPGKNVRNMIGNFDDMDNLMDLLNKMFEYLPEKRISAKEALQHPFFKDY